MVGTPDEALQDVRGYASAGRVVVTSHARQRMQERGARMADVQAALAGATRCEPAKENRWKVTGPDLDGDELSAIVVVEDGVVVITLF